MSHIKTDKISARTASGTITLGESGEKISFVSPLNATTQFVKTSGNDTSNNAFISAYRAGDGVVSGNRVAILSKGDGAGNATALRFDTDSTERLRIDSDGIKFNGDTSAANALNDYEEGIWTPTLSASAGSNPTAISANGDYTKIGNLVFINFSILNITAGNDSNAFIKVINLPFSVDYNSPSLAAFFDNVTFVSGRTMITGNISGSDYILFRQSGSAVSDTALDNAHINNGVSDIFASGFYYTAQ